MGFSDPSANLCDSTAPMVYAEASQDMINSLAGPKCINKFDDLSKFFAVWKLPNVFETTTILWMT